MWDAFTFVSEFFATTEWLRARRGLFSTCTHLCWTNDWTYDHCRYTCVCSIFIISDTVVHIEQIKANDSRIWFVVWNRFDMYHTTVKIVRLSVTVGDRGRQRAARGCWLTPQPASSRRWAVELWVFTHAHVSMITYRVDVYQIRPIGASLLCLGGNGLHCSSYRQNSRDLSLVTFESQSMHIKVGANVIVIIRSII